MGDNMSCRDFTKSRLVFFWQIQPACFLLGASRWLGLLFGDVLIWQNESFAKLKDRPQVWEAQNLQCWNILKDSFEVTSNENINQSNLNHHVLTTFTPNLPLNTTFLELLGSYPIFTPSGPRRYGSCRSWEGHKRSRCHSLAPEWPHRSSWSRAPTRIGRLGPRKQRERPVENKRKNSSPANGDTRYDIISMSIEKLGFVDFQSMMNMFINNTNHVHGNHIISYSRENQSSRVAMDGCV